MVSSPHPYDKELRKQKNKQLYIPFYSIAKKYPVCLRIFIAIFWIFLIFIFLPTSNSNSHYLIDNEPNFDKYLPLSIENSEEANSVFQNIASNFLDNVSPLWRASDSTESEESIEKTKKLSDLYSDLTFSTSGYWKDKYTLDDLLTVCVGPHKGEKLNTIDDLKFYDSDPRLTLSVYFDYYTALSDKFEKVNNENNNENTNLFKDPLIPFSWYDWVDFHDFNKLISLEKTQLSCPFFYEAAFENETLTNIEKEIREPLFTYNREHYNQPHWYDIARSQWTSINRYHIDRFCKNQKPETIDFDSKEVRFDLPFHVKSCLHQVRVEVYQLQAKSFLLNEVSPPISISIIENKYDQVHRFFINPDTKKNIVESGLLQNYILKNKKNIETESYSNTEENEKIDLEFDHLEKWEKFKNSKIFIKSKVSIKESETPTDEEMFVHLKKSDFEFDAREKIKELESIGDDLNQHELNYLNSLKDTIAEPGFMLGKYFEEPEEIYNYGKKGAHHDRRFFKNLAVLNQAERDQRLNSMIRTWLKFTKNNGLVTWLAHGTLIGYQYSGVTLPWDADFDVQMPIRYLHLLAQYFNQTIVMEDPLEGNGKYLIDISHNILSRDRGNGRTKIDARFIDIESGSYIDITGLAVSSNKVSRNFEFYVKDRLENSDWDWNKIDRKMKGSGELLASLTMKEITELIENGFENNSTIDRKIVDALKDEFAYHSLKESINPYKDLLKSDNYEKQFDDHERYIIHRELGLYNCRDEHFYEFNELSPLIKTGYHGVEALIPHDVIRLINREYRSTFEYKYDSFEGFTYLPEFRNWVDSRLITKCSNGRNWYPIFKDGIKHGLNDLDIEDLKILVDNVKEYNDVELLSNFFRTMEMTAYRTKEIAIQHDKSLTKGEQLKLLNDLRLKVLPTVKNPANDPLFYKEDKERWEEIVKGITGGFNNELELNRIQRVIEVEKQKVADQLWSFTNDLYNRNNSLFSKYNGYDDPFNGIDDNGKYNDFNNFGINLFNNSDVKNMGLNRQPFVELYDLDKEEWNKETRW
ncbi:hypothetical protein TBLA_0B01980 [Henningerozyma blattae CBS 6284]|uniref:LicD/FKTN/FKRP nucleotidyltransferase domain-containing protein n=1 Tax=Henningerozyma blattae (strain ATCC 34711 / CBS 6284 / DSM 70876 / NBRC 10599 / NRRL Y-10934 / UCD 77-7) TaxID=1071380 RepID=I2GY39_HENB6|nr:hypothetical protein TBLA_0B01980 [Tetrapisispora blattae CBS 6284]CCH59041.1 hypothetical protein TBLA_0B01980 [Tetrapisispora blattae CBS 6284]